MQLKMRLKMMIAKLHSSVRHLDLMGDGTWNKTNRIVNDVKSGRAYVLQATGQLERARQALAAGDEPEAWQRLAQAQASYITALHRNHEDRERLMVRPAGAGRKVRLDMKARLYALASTRDERFIADKCKAAIAADEALFEHYGVRKVTDNGLRIAFNAGKTPKH